MKVSSCACCAPGENRTRCSAPDRGADHDHDPGRSLAEADDHHHNHDHGDGSPQREMALLGAAGLFFALVMIFEEGLTVRFGSFAAPLLYAIPYLVCGWSVFRTAGRLILARDVMNEFTLMAGATLVAVGLGQYAEAVGVMLFYRIGEFFQELATERSRRSVQGLLASKPTTAHVLRGDTTATMDVDAVRVGDSVVVRAGEKVPLDGVVLSGSTHVDQSPLTGESVPVAVTEGDPVLGGSINAGGVITVMVTAAFADTHMARVLEMVQNAAQNKAPTERFLTRFARYYTPAVVTLAALVAALPPLVGGGDWHTWIYRALVLKVKSCP
ncbi:MAG: HAD-IC family P-type ATPase [Deltaproteobacteria bacterium]|nr:HAD-IC family P-type ATPase [Deltaproteobacteria bacterium]